MPVKEEEQILRPFEDSFLGDLEPHFSESASASSCTVSAHASMPLMSIAMMALSIALLAGNILLYIQNINLKLAIEDQGFTGIYKLGKTWNQFQTYTKYSDTNHSISDIAWSSFQTNGFVAIPHEQAAEFGLPVAEDFPDDSRKGVYVLGGFHEIHCVIYLREAIKDLMAGISVEDRGIHINHCYDALRQSIQCRADDTPLYIPYRSRLTGDGQFRTCRNWNALTNWAKDHSACWPTGHCADIS